MKLVHIINNLGKGGAEKLLIETLPFYKQAGHEVEVVMVTANGSVPEYKERLVKAGINVHTLTEGNIYSFRNVFTLRKFFKNFHFDIAHLHVFPSMYWFPLALLGQKQKGAYIFTEHSTNNRRWNKWYFKLSDNFIYKKYDAIIAITADVKANLIKWMSFLERRTVVINNGINVDVINKEPIIDRDNLKRLIDIKDQNAVILLMTARLDKLKGHNTLARAMAQLPKNYYVLFAGEGPEKENLELLGKELGISERIKFLGFRSDVLSLMKSVDINILCSHYEGLSGVTLEALCSGRPFLGSNVSGINNVVPDERFLFNSGDEEDLARKICEIISSIEIRNKMISDCKDYVKDWDISIMIQKHLELYDQLFKRMHNLKNE